MFWAVQFNFELNRVAFYHLKEILLMLFDDVKL